MKINNNENIVLIDVDETLVSFDIKGKESETIDIKNGIHTEVVVPLTQHIEMLKQHKIRGHYIRIHSQGGYEWALNVIKTLGLESYVDSIETKPKWYIDDLPAEAWMSRVYKVNK